MSKRVWTVVADGSIIRRLLGAKDEDGNWLTEPEVPGLAARLIPNIGCFIYPVETEVYDAEVYKRGDDPADEKLKWRKTKRLRCPRLLPPLLHHGSARRPRLEGCADREGRPMNKKEILRTRNRVLALTSSVVAALEVSGATEEGTDLEDFVLAATALGVITSAAVTLTSLYKDEPDDREEETSVSEFVLASVLVAYNEGKKAGAAYHAGLLAGVEPLAIPHSYTGAAKAAWDVGWEEEASK